MSCLVSLSAATLETFHLCRTLPSPLQGHPSAHSIPGGIGGSPLTAEAGSLTSRLVRDHRVIPPKQKLWQERGTGEAHS